MRLGYKAEMETIGSSCYSSFTILTPFLFPFPVDTFAGRLPSKRVGLIPCSVITIFVFSRREFSILSRFLSVWALPTKFFIGSFELTYRE
jgi:hypothetical protein